MGRTLKRVPLDFDWSLDTTWQGYINPHYKPCPDVACQYGCTPARSWLEAITHLILIAGSETAKGGAVTHPWLWALRNAPGVLPSSDMADLSTGLAERSPDSFLGHDAVDRWTATRKIIQAAGMDPDTWGICPTCKGHCVDPETYEAWEAWEKSEPPTGDGYQLWEDITEGSPQSPVFATLQELCAWCEEHATTFGDARASAQEWEKMFSEGIVYHQQGGAIFL